VEESFKCKFIIQEQPKRCDVIASGNAPRNSETKYRSVVLDLPSSFRY